MKNMRHQTQGPKNEWARLYKDQSDASSEALKLLRKTGYCVIAFPINGKIGPELILGRHVYRGLARIKEAIRE